MSDLAAWPGLRPALALAFLLPASALMPGLAADGGAIAARPMVLAQAGVPADEAQFLQDAVEASLAEVSFGRLAADRASNPQVRAFAAELARAHEDARGRLAAMAFGAGVAVPATMNAAHEALIAQLQQLGGAAFDQQFVQGQIAIHQIALRIYAEAAGGGPVGTFAAEMLPVLQRHLDVAEGLGRSPM